MADELPRSLLGNPQAPNVDADHPPTRELGAVSQNVGGIGGWSAFVDELERTPELMWPQSIETYHAMRSDSQIEALRLGTVQPIMEYRWMIDPNKADSKLVERCATDWGLPIKGSAEDEDGVKRAANKFDFLHFLADALLSPMYGMFDFEVVGEVEEGKDWRMRKMAPRHPRTVEEFRTNEVGDLLGIKQRFGQQLAAIPPEIPAWALVHFVWQSEAQTHLGRSMLRSMYREWLVKDRTMRIAVINLQRAGGVPVITGPQGASDKDIEDLAKLARQFKVAEGGGGAVPFGSKLDLVGGNVPDAIALVKYCDEAMARVWALMLVQLGVTQGANRALGGEFAIYAARAQRLMARWVCATVNEFLDRYTEWNDPMSDYAPLLTFEPSKPEGMSVTDLVSLLDSGALTVDPELEDWLRSEYALPEKPEAPKHEELGELAPDEVAMIQQKRNPPALPGQPGYKQTPLPSKTLDPTATEPTIAKTGTRDIPRIRGGIRASLTLPDRELRRPPSQNEIAAAVDFRALDSAHSRTVARVHEHYINHVLPGQIRRLANDVRGGSPASSLTVPPSGQRDLARDLHDVAKEGAEQAFREAQAQGVLIPEPSREDALAEVRSKVTEQAEHIAQVNANGLALAAQRHAPRTTPEGLEEHLKGMKHVFERENLRGAVTFAQNMGRIAAMQALAPENPTATYEASEILDTATCTPCEAVDGKVYDTPEEAEADYATGGYVDCEGGPNCRGTLVAIYPEQNPEGGENELREAEPAYVQPEPEPKPPPPVEPSAFSPVMTLRDAEAFSEGSAITETLYHGTTSTAAEAIKREGFNAAAEIRNPPYRGGVSFSRDLNIARAYAHGAERGERGAGAGRGEVVMARVNVHHVADEGEFLDIYRMAQTQVSDTTSKEFGEAVGRIAAERGFDAAVTKAAEGEVLVFDVRNVAVINDAAKRPVENLTGMDRVKALVGDYDPATATVKDTQRIGQAVLNQAVVRAAPRKQLEERIREVEQRWAAEAEAAFRTEREGKEGVPMHERGPHGAAARELADEVKALTEEAIKLPTHSEAIRQVLSEVRPMGGELPIAPGARQQIKREALEHASYFPSAWIDRVKLDGPIKLSEAQGRGRHSYRWTGSMSRIIDGKPYSKVTGSTVRVSPSRLEGKMSDTLAHEMMHRFQLSVPGIQRLEDEYWQAATEGEEMQRLKTLQPEAGYGPDEIAKPDLFSDPYSGRFYAEQRDLFHDETGTYASLRAHGGHPAEVVTMGLQKAFAGSWGADSQTHFILGLLAAL